MKSKQQFLEQKNRLLEYWKKFKIINSKNILKAFRKIPREAFIPEPLKSQVYEDHPLPIGYGQTISQPTTVAIMTQALNPKPGEKVLEVGTGSGYQAAIIAEIVKPGVVITTELVSELAAIAKNNLYRANIRNVKVFLHDGSLGFKKEAPYDRIIVTAAAPRISQHWVEQLKTNGVIIAPIGSLTEQELIRAVKTKQGLKTQSLGDFVFVPLKGKEGWFE